MFNLQGSEIIVILVLALVVLGPEKLPSAIRQFTKTYAELRKMGNGFQSELKDALEEPMREMRETANVVRDATDPAKLVAEAEAEQRLEHTRAMEEASPVADAPPATEWAARAFPSPAPGAQPASAAPPPPPSSAAAAAAAASPPPPAPPWTATASAAPPPPAPSAPSSPPPHAPPAAAPFPPRRSESSA